MKHKPGNGSLEGQQPQRSPVLRLIDRVLTGIVLVLGGGALAFLCVLSTVNVLLMRKVLNAPIFGAEDLMILTLVLIVAVSIAFGGRVGSHIEIEVLDTVLAPRTSQVSRAAMKLMAAAIVGLLAVHLWIAGGRAGNYGESSQSLLISFGPFYRILAVGMGAYVIVLLAEFYEMARGRASTMALTVGHKPE